MKDSDEFWDTTGRETEHGFAWRKECQTTWHCKGTTTESSAIVQRAAASRNRCAASFPRSVARKQATS